MNKPSPSSTETLLRKSSWAGFVIGAGLIVLSAIYEMRQEESKASLDYYRGEVASGRLTLDSTTRALMEHNIQTYQDHEYWRQRVGGLALILIGLASSLYANKLRKTRIGS